MWSFFMTHVLPVLVGVLARHLPEWARSRKVREVAQAILADNNNPISTSTAAAEAAMIQVNLDRVASAAAKVEKAFNGVATH